MREPCGRDVPAEVEGARDVAVARELEQVSAEAVVVGERPEDDSAVGERYRRRASLIADETRRVRPGERVHPARRGARAISRPVVGGHGHPAAILEHVAHRGRPARRQIGGVHRHDIRVSREAVRAARNEDGSVGSDRRRCIDRGSLEAAAQARGMLHGAARGQRRKGLGIGIDGVRALAVRVLRIRRPRNERRPGNDRRGAGADPDEESERVVVAPRVGEVQLDRRIEDVSGGRRGERSGDEHARVAVERVGATAQLAREPVELHHGAVARRHPERIAGDHRVELWLPPAQRSRARRGAPVRRRLPVGRDDPARHELIPLPDEMLLIPDLPIPRIGAAREGRARSGRAARDVRAGRLHRGVDVVTDDERHLVVDQERTLHLRGFLRQVRIEHERGNPGKRYSAGANGPRVIGSAARLGPVGGSGAVELRPGCRRAVRAAGERGAHGQERKRLSHGAIVAPAPPLFTGLTGDPS